MRRVHRRCDPLLETGVDIGDGGGWLLAMAIAAPPAPLADAAVDSGVEEDEEGEGDDAQHDEAAPVVVARVDVVHAHGRDGDERAGLRKQKRGERVSSISRLNRNIGPAATERPLPRAQRKCQERACCKG